ncbi:hypothetical protein EDD40_0174 [Saccharothrix texasensis]|uniref:Uncharacterized protein n=1 Tax=Saccharothrix texasensis TaxID=103734 RepID=A0A3N1GXA3_9PSEU|nr:hypothetical protein EDD40_0174 [Saccharothrix texasensis]
MSGDGETAKDRRTVPMPASQSSTVAVDLKYP